MTSLVTLKRLRLDPPSPGSFCSSDSCPTTEPADSPLRRALACGSFESPNKLALTKAVRIASQLQCNDLFKLHDAMNCVVRSADGESSRYYCESKTNYPVSITVIQNYIFLHHNRLPKSGSFNYVRDGILLTKLGDDEVEVSYGYLLREPKPVKRPVRPLKSFYTEELELTKNLDHPALGCHPTAIAVIDGTQKMIIPNFGTATDDFPDFFNNGFAIAQAAKTVAQGLCYIHKKGIYHNDIRPDNIVVQSGRWETKIIDFGQATEDGSEFEMRICPDYCPPDKVEYEYSHVKASPKYDYYALGATINYWIEKSTTTVPKEMEDFAKRLMSDDCTHEVLQELANYEPPEEDTQFYIRRPKRPRLATKVELP